MRASAALFLAAAASAGCATTEVTSESTTLGRGPRPERGLVHAFATSPEDVKLDHSLSTIAWKLEGTTESAERREVGRAVAEKLADHLVTKIRALGLPTERLPKMTCEAFAAHSSDSQIRVAAYLDGYSKRGKPIEDVAEVDVERDVAVLVEECRIAPKASVWERIEKKFE